MNQATSREPNALTDSSLHLFIGAGPSPYVGEHLEPIMGFREFEGAEIRQGKIIIVFTDEHLPTLRSALSILERRAARKHADLLAAAKIPDHGDTCDGDQT